MVVILLLSNPNGSATTGCDDYSIEDDDDNNSTSTGITAIPTTTYFSQRYPYPNFTPPKYVKFKIDGEDDDSSPPPRPPLPKEYSFYEPNKVPKPPRHIYYQNKSSSKPKFKKHPTAPSATTTSTSRDYVRHVTRVNFFDSQVEFEGGEDGDTEAITKEGEYFLVLKY